MRISGVVAVTCLTLTGLASADPADAAIRKETRIGAQELATALRIFAKDRDVQLVYRSDVVKDQRTAGAAGDLTFDEALLQLLIDTGLTYRYLDKNAITIVPRAAIDGSDKAKRDKARAGEKAIERTSGNLSWRRFRLAQAVSTASQASDLTDNAGSAAPDARGERTENGGQSTLEEIVVTAERRASTVQQTPIAVSALSGASLEKSFVSSLDGLQGKVPGFQLGDNFGLARIAIRGVSTENVLGGSIGGDPGVSYSINGVTIGRPQAASTELYDIERVEVLRGPQGTLYGRNATGGALNIITKAPGNEPNGYVDLLGGSRERARIRAAFGAPVSDDVGVRFAGFAERGDGFIKNLDSRGDDNIGDTRHFGLRGALTAQVNSAVSLDVFADYYHRDNEIGAYIVQPNVRGETDPQTQLGGVFGADLRHVYYDFNGSQDYRDLLTTGATLDVDLERVRLTSVTAYAHSNTNNAFDLDGSSATYLDTTFRRNKASQFSQELRLASNGDERWRWLLGAYFFSEHSTAEQDFSFRTLGLEFLSGGSVDTRSVAAFGQTEFELTPTLRLIGGVRWTRDTKKGDEYFSFGTGMSRDLPEESWTAVTPRVAIQYTPAPDLMLYASATRGFKSGGFNIGALQEPYEPEYIWSYEAGVKSQLLSRRLSANLALFHYDYTDQQFTQILGVLAILTNAGSSRAAGAELELAYSPNEHVEIGATYAYLRARFSSFLNLEDQFPELGVQDLSGNTLPRSPDHSVALFAETTFNAPGDLEVTPRIEARYTSRTYFSEFNRRFSSQGPVTLLNASVRFNRGRYYGSLFVNNLTDRITRNNSTITAQIVGYNNVVNVAPPRSFGVQLGVNFQ